MTPIMYYPTMTLQFMSINYVVYHAMIHPFGNKRHNIIDIVGHYIQQHELKINSET